MIDETGPEIGFHAEPIVENEVKVPVDFGNLRALLLA